MTETPKRCDLSDMVVDGCYHCKYGLTVMPVTRQVLGFDETD